MLKIQLAVPYLWSNDGGAMTIPDALFHEKAPWRDARNLLFNNISRAIIRFVIEPDRTPRNERNR